MTLRTLAVLLAAGLLFACAAPAPKPPAKADPVSLRLELAALPGTTVSDREPLTVSYEGEVLFSRGAVLFYAGGTELLSPLADLLLAHPEAGWLGEVRAETGLTEDYDLSLAQQRMELLRRYFVNRGIDAGRLEWSAQPGEGAPLTLSLKGDQEPSVSSSSAPKR